jgi:plastocyanin
MTRLRAILVAGLVGGLVAACSGPGGGYGYGVGAGVAATATPVATVAASQTPAATATDSSSGGKSDYDYGGGSGGRYGSGGSTARSPAGSAAPGTVQLTGFAFQPGSLTVGAGTTVSFVNDDPADHRLVEGENGTAVTGSSIDATVAPGATAMVVLSKAGTVRITCTIHPSMNLTVTVTP